jgi:hypothetical protein
MEIRELIKLAKETTITQEMVDAMKNRIDDFEKRLEEKSTAINQEFLDRRYTL